jgi:hypothetical protein
VPLKPTELFQPTQNWSENDVASSISNLPRHVKSSDPYARKSYAMQRMSQAIQRAIASPTINQKMRAAKWAAAWGLMCGIKATNAELRLGHEPKSLANKISRRLKTGH